MQTTCPCGTNKPFERCCGRFLTANNKAKTPEQLMRSRYSAYALGGYGDYLLDTWHPATRPDIKPADMSRKELDWLRLEVLHKSQKGNQAQVEFKAWHKSDDGGEECLHERSEFSRINGTWYYVGGEVED